MDHKKTNTDGIINEILCYYAETTCGFPMSFYSKAFLKAKISNMSFSETELCMEQNLHMKEFAEQICLVMKRKNDET